MKTVEQVFCARCYAVKTTNHLKCPNCELGHKVYDKYCKRCMHVHLSVFTKCAPWVAKAQ